MGGVSIKRGGGLEQRKAVVVRGREGVKRESWCKMKREGGESSLCGTKWPMEEINCSSRRRQKPG